MMRILRNGRFAGPPVLRQTDSATAVGRLSQLRNMNDKDPKQPGAALGAMIVRSDNTNDEQAEAIRKSPAYLKVRDELFRIYDDIGERLTETLKPLGIDVVQVHIRSAIPKDVRGLYEKLSNLRIVPEAKADVAKTRDEFPSWLNGNWCE
jgi:hypothetical protein